MWEVLWVAVLSSVRLCNITLRTHPVSLNLVMSHVSYYFNYVFMIWRRHTGFTWALRRPIAKLFERILPPVWRVLMQNICRRVFCIFLWFTWCVKAFRGPSTSSTLQFEILKPCLQWIFITRVSAEISNDRNLCF